MSQHIAEHTKTMVSSFWMITITCGLLLLVHLSLRFYYGSLGDGIDLVALGLTILGLLPWIASFLEKIKVGGLELTIFRQLEEQGRDLKAIEFLLLNFLSVHEVEHLIRLANNRKLIANMNWDKERLDRFQQELRHLRDLRLISKREGKSISDIFNQSPPQVVNLHDYIEITESGRAYLELRGRWKVAFAPTSSSNSEPV